MYSIAQLKTPLLLGAVLSTFVLAGCSPTSHSISAASLVDAVTPNFTRSQSFSSKDKECMARAMFFESRRSSREGMIAVGTVVMNRKRSGQYPSTVCGVVGQKGQFAPGVLTRKMDSKALPDVMAAAEAVLKGERHPRLKNAMHFHTAGLKFKYKNMHYVTVAGGNSFYEKRSRNWKPLPAENGAVMMASNKIESAPAAKNVSDASMPALALSETSKSKAEVITAAIPLANGIRVVPADAFAAPTLAPTGPMTVAEDVVPAFQPATNDPADIDPARFQ